MHDFYLKFFSTREINDFEAKLKLNCWTCFWQKKKFRIARRTKSFSLCLNDHVKIFSKFIHVHQFFTNEVSLIQNIDFDYTLKKIRKYWWEDKKARKLCSKSFNVSYDFVRSFNIFLSLIPWKSLFYLHDKVSIIFEFYTNIQCKFV